MVLLYAITVVLFSLDIRTITGILSRTVIQGEGVTWRNIGRIVLALNGGAVLAEASDHDTWALLVGDLSGADGLCAAMP